MSILQLTLFAVDGVSHRDPAFAKARLSACANVVVMSNYEVNTMHDDDDVDGAWEKNLWEDAEGDGGAFLTLERKIERLEGELDKSYKPFSNFEFHTQPILSELPQDFTLSNIRDAALHEKSPCFQRKMTNFVAVVLEGDLFRC